VSPLGLHVIHRLTLQLVFHASPRVWVPRSRGWSRNGASRRCQGRPVAWSRGWARGGVSRLAPGHDLQHPVACEVALYRPSSCVAQANGIQLMVPSVLRILQLALVAFAAVAAEPVRELGSPESLLPPCYVPTGITTVDWKSTHLFTRPGSFRLPRAFVRDSTRQYHHGGIRWVDGPRTLEQVNGMWGSFGEYGTSPGYSSCADTLGGVPFRLITTYWSSYPAYAVVAIPTDSSSWLQGYNEALIGMSPDSSDQRLFLAIFRTFRGDSLHRGDVKTR